MKAIVLSRNLWLDVFLVLVVLHVDVNLTALGLLDQLIRDATSHHTEMIKLCHDC